MNNHDTAITVPAKAECAFRYLKQHGYLLDLGKAQKLVTYARWKHNGFWGYAAAMAFHTWRAQHEFATTVIDFALDAEEELTEKQFLAALPMALETAEANRQEKREKDEAKALAWEREEAQAHSALKDWVARL